MSDACPLLRCFDCGEFFGPRQITRQTIKVAQSSDSSTAFSTSGDFLAGSGQTNYYAPVDLCLRCACLRKRTDDAGKTSLVLVLLSVPAAWWLGTQMQSLVAGLVSFGVLFVLSLVIAQSGANSSNPLPPT